MSDIRLDGDAAVVGGVHSDSHDTINNITNTSTTNNVNNSQTVYLAQKTDSELQQANEQLFLQAVAERMTDGILDNRRLAELSQLRLQYQISVEQANRIIDQVRKSSAILGADLSNEFLTSQLLEEVFNAIMDNRTDIINRKFNSLEKLAAISSDTNVQFYYHMLLASQDPATCELTLIKSSTDNYWQLFWAHIAYLKNGNPSKADTLMPKLGAFGAPHGDISLLLAVDSVYDYLNKDEDEYYLDQTRKHLENATRLGMSEQLSPLWYAVNHIISKGEPTEKWFEFYVETTLDGFVARPVSSEIGTPTLEATSPPMPRFNPQAVNLRQMQGFNPLDAANNMQLGQMAQMPQMNNTFISSPNNGFGVGMPQTPPPMPSQYEKSVAPSAPPAMQVSHAATKEVDHSDPFVDLNGIIFTDTETLANKYGIGREEVINIFADFTQKAEEQLMHWAFLDVADWRGTLSDFSWNDYNALVSAFIDRYQIPSGPELHLMIVGGDDVIPIPQIKDIYGSSDTGFIPTDTAYSFEGNFIPDLIEGADLKFVFENARNNVARLPLEDGKMSTDIRADIGAYFNISGMYGGGIPVRRVVMTSHEEWIPASTTMSQHLPLICDESAVEITTNRMYISPTLFTDDPDTMSIYEGAIDRADMLMFNLHGASDPSMSGFYSEGEAFNPSLLPKSNARVFNTVACYGARYHGYNRDESMLLKALYGGGILLYTGSLIPVPMYHSDETREMLLHPGTGSEVFMRLLPLYQLKGITAGQALLKAKCDYFNMMRHIENDDFSLATALMFCLYGNPMLHVRENSRAVEAARNNTIIPADEIKSTGGPVKSAKKQRIMQRTAPHSVSLVDTLRGYVDQNLSAIRNYVEQYVHQALGLPPQYLDSIDSVNRYTPDGMVVENYMFNYHNPDTCISPDTKVETDSRGAVIRVYTTK